MCAPRQTVLYLKLKCSTCVHFLSVRRAVALKVAQHIAASSAYQTPRSQRLKPFLREDEEDDINSKGELGVLLKHGRLRALKTPQMYRRVAN